MINGMGGVGKTSLCRQLAHQSATLLNSVIWLDSQSGLQTALQRLVAPRLQIDIEQPNWLALLIDKLNQTVAPAVLFLDNLELADGQAQDSAILHQLKRLNWHLVATARYPLPQFSHHHPIEVLPVEHCIKLFKQYYDAPLNDEEQSSLNTLIALAGQHPLTVELLAKIACDGGLTVAKMLAQVKNTRFDLRQLTDVSVEGQHSGTEWQDERQHQLHQHLSQLFQLVKLNADQQNTLSTLEQDFLKAFTARFNQAIQPDETEHWIEKTRYIEQLLTLIDAVVEAPGISCSLLMTLAILYETQGQYGEALPLYLRALDIRQKNLGPEHFKVANTMANLGRLYQAMGHYQHALPLMERALAVQERHLDAKDPQIATILNNLATLYLLMGDNQQALPLMQQALAINEGALGAEHPDTIALVSNMAAVYLDAKEYEKALALLLRSYEVTEKNFGSEHPTLAVIFNDLAGIYQIIGQYEQALSLFQRALAIQEKSFGPEHPDVATRLINLAGLYDAMKNYQKALPLVVRALAIQKKYLGTDHPYIATSLNNLGLLQHSLNNEPQALTLLLQSLAIRESVFGVEHPTVNESLHHLAQRYPLIGEHKGKCYQAQFLAKLLNIYNWPENEIIEKTQITKAELRNNLRAATLIEQYQASDHDDLLDDTLFALFKAIAGNVPIRAWSGLNGSTFDTNPLKANNGNLALLFDLLSGQRVINTQADIDLLGKLVTDSQAVTLLTKNRSLNTVYQDSGLAIKDQHAEQVNQAVTN